VVVIGAVVAVVGVVSSPTSTTNNGPESDICADAETEKTGQGQEIHRRGDAMQRDLPSPAQGDLAVTTTTTTTSNHCHPHQRNFCGLSKAFRIHPAQPRCISGSS